MSNNINFPKLYKGEGNVNHLIYELAKEKIIIPLYQRNYSWTTVNVNCLLSDIFKKFKEKMPIWLGAILVSVSNNHSDGSILLVDGQQRLMTMFLIFKELIGNAFSINRIEDENAKLRVYEKNLSSVNSSLISAYLESSSKNTPSSSYFSRILSTIRKYRGSADAEFIQYLKNSVYCTVLVIENNYEFFENLNSKNLPLTLTEKCIAFLTGTFAKTESPNQYFVNNIDLLKFLPKSKIPSKDIIERFVNIFYKDAFAGTDDYFANFKKIISNSKSLEGLKNFFNFLQEIRTFERANKDDFSLWYLWNICLKDYWLIYVWIKIQFKETNFLNIFLDQVWKFDLIRHLNGIAKTSIKNAVVNFVTSPNFGKEKWQSLMWKIMKQSPNGTDVDENKNKQIIFKGKAKDINYEIPNFKTKRFKCLFYLLYAEEPFNEKIMQITFAVKNNIEKDDITVDHLLPSSKVQDYANVYGIEVGCNLIKNLWLLKDKTNKKFGAMDIDKKVKKYDAGGTHAFLFALNKNVIRDWNSVGINFEEYSIAKKGEIIKNFWQKREKDLNFRIEKIRKKCLTIDLDTFENSFSEERKIQKNKTIKLIKEYLKLKNISDNKKQFFSQKYQTFVFFSFFDFKGVKAGDTTRVQMSPTNFEWFRAKKIEFKNSIIIGFHLDLEKFYSFINWNKFFKLKRSGNASLHFNDTDWKEYNLEVDGR